MNGIIQYVVFVTNFCLLLDLLGEFSGFCNCVNFFRYLVSTEDIFFLPESSKSLCLIIIF